LTLYVNGELQGRFNKGFETQFLASGDVFMGYYYSSKNQRYTQAVFDDISIYHRVLSQKEILDLYNAPNPNHYKQILKDSIKYIVIILIFIAIILVISYRNKQNLKKQKEQLELNNRISELELKVVKAQMNPHFISNSLAAIQELIYKDDNHKAGQYLAKFSYFFRQVLYYSDKNYISLEEEINLIKLNIELEQLRFKNNFDFILNINKDVDLEETLIPSLITQTFIENAIWHGLLPLNNIRKPKLIISIEINNNLPQIIIEDNGIGRKKELLNKSNSKGTKLILDKMYNLNKLNNTSNYQLQIIDLFDTENKSIGTKIILQLDNI
jgi:LytS/YehU family sensor histidine kinase